MPEITEGRYYIQLSTGRSLEASDTTFQANRAKIQTWKLYRGLNQLWEVRRASSGTFFLLNVGGGRALDAHDAEVDHNGCRIQLFDHFPENRNQQWILRSLGANNYAIRCAASRSNKVIQIKEGVIDRSAEAELSDFLDAPSQKWTFTPAHDAAIVQPNIVDLRPNQTPIKDQGSRGSCTYFGATAALEAAYKKAGYGDVNLSEEFWAMMGKALYLHPGWPEILAGGANYRENQFAGTQGGGSVRWYPSGFRIATETDVAYRTTDYAPDNWASVNQKEANDFNFSLLTRAVLQAPRYYGASHAVAFTRGSLTSAAEFERVLSLGFEVSIHRLGHNFILVGFDKSDPASPVFFVKNSYGPLGGDPTVYCERLLYTDLFTGIEVAEYLTDVVPPAAWPELAFLGRWNLTFDGHKGILDIYHLPGVGNLPLDVPATADHRIGVFYDPAGTAFRVNGTISGHRIEFRFDAAHPNLPWDELRGRRFVYHLEPTLDVMAGMHYDGDGSSFGGYAKKGSPIVHGTPARLGFPGLASTTWNVLIGNLQGQIRFGAVSGAGVNGVLTLAGGHTRNVEASLLSTGEVTFWVEGVPGLAMARFLNHESGLLCGSTTDGRPFYSAYVAPR